MNVLDSEYSTKTIDVVEWVIRSCRSDLSNDEWDATRAFIRTFYNISEDMSFLSGNMKPELKEQARGLIKDFKKLIKSYVFLIFVLTAAS